MNTAHRRCTLFVAALLLFAAALTPSRATACGRGGGGYPPGLAVLVLTAIGIGAVDVILTGVDVGLAVQHKRPPKILAGTGLALSLPGILTGIYVTSVGASNHANPGTIALGLAWTAVPLALAVYSIYVLGTPDRAPPFVPSLEIPALGGLRHLSLAPTLIPTKGLGVAANLQKPGGGVSSTQLAPGMALAFQF